MNTLLCRKSVEFLLFALIPIIIAITYSCASSPQIGSRKATLSYRFFGGPKEGTFKFFAKGISDLGKNRGIKIIPTASAGSYENVRRINSNSDSMAVAYATHIYQARNGLLKNDPQKYENIMVLGYFYGAPAQLVVNKNSGINSAYQLNGKRVGIGNRGSGTAAQAEIFFKGIGVWDKIQKKYNGHIDASDSFNRGEIDALWLFTAFPSGAVIMAAQTNDIKLISIYKDGEKADFFNKNPFYEKIIIPLNTYRGVHTDTLTYQDSALWIAHKNVPDDIVLQLLDEVYSEKGIQFMITQKKTASKMLQNNGTFGISTPLHPGAIKYYFKLK